jgi:hypothetical protein
MVVFSSYLKSNIVPLAVVYSDVQYAESEFCMNEEKQEVSLVIPFGVKLMKPVIREEGITPSQVRARTIKDTRGSDQETDR